MQHFDMRADEYRSPLDADPPDSTHPFLCIHLPPSDLSLERLHVLERIARNFLLEIFGFVSQDVEGLGCRFRPQLHGLQRVT